MSQIASDTEKPEIRSSAVYTLREACLILQIGDETMRRWIKSGRIQVGQIGRGYRILGSQLLDALDPLPNQETSDTPTKGARP